MSLPETYLQVMMFYESPEEWIKEEKEDQEWKDVIDEILEQK